MSITFRRTAPDRMLVVLAVIAFLEGVALAIYSVFDLVEALRLGATGPADVSNGPAIVLQILIFALFGAGLIIVAWGWWHARRWARGPFVLAQLIGLVVGIPLASSEGSIERAIGIAVTVMAIAGIVISLTPAVTRAIESDAA